MIPQFRLLCYLSSLSLYSGHSGPVLNLRTDDAAHASLPIPHSLLVDMNVCTSSLQVFVVRCIFCVFFFFFPLIIFSSEITKLPTDTPVKGFPIVWELLLFHDSLPRNGSQSLHLLSLFSSFIFCAAFSQRDLADILGAWCPLPAFRSCSVEVAQHSNDLLMNL